MSGKTKAGDHPHIGLAVLSAGVMALALAGGLGFLGVTGRLDDFAEALFLPKGMGEPTLNPGDPYARYRWLVRRRWWWPF